MALRRSAALAALALTALPAASGAPPTAPPPAVYLASFTVRPLRALRAGRRTQRRALLAARMHATTAWHAAAARSGRGCGCAALHNAPRSVTPAERFAARSLRTGRRARCTTAARRRTTASSTPTATASSTTSTANTVRAFPHAHPTRAIQLRDVPLAALRSPRARTACTRLAPRATPPRPLAAPLAALTRTPFSLGKRHVWLL